MNLHTAACRANEALDDHHVLKPLVLDEQPVDGAVDESTDPVPSGSRAPNQVTSVGRRKCLAVPVGLEALDDLGHLMAPLRDHRVVARL